MIECTDIAAPRGALSYTRLSREELGGMFLGLMTYLGPKAPGGQQHVRKPVDTAKASRVGHRGTRVIWKSALIG
jgi:hypothetical protein